MTEKEMILNILDRISLKVYYQDDRSIEFANSYGYENIVIDFDDDGNVVSIYC